MAWSYGRRVVASARGVWRRGIGLARWPIISFSTARDTPACSRWGAQGLAAEGAIRRGRGRRTGGPCLWPAACRKAGLEHATRRLAGGRRERWCAGGRPAALQIVAGGRRRSTGGNRLAWRRHMTAAPLEERDEGIPGAPRRVTGLQEARIAQAVGLAGGLARRAWCTGARHPSTLHPALLLSGAVAVSESRLGVSTSVRCCLMWATPPDVRTRKARLRGPAIVYPTV